MPIPIRPSRLWLLALLACAPCLRAQEGETRGGMVFFEPDAATRREIQNQLIDPTGVGSGTRDVRTAARKRLTEIGPWTVPFLCRAIAKGSGDRVPMNCVFALARVGDYHCIPTLEGAVAKHSHAETRTAAALALGTFRAGLTPLNQLVDPKEDRRFARAALLALAKIPGGSSTLLTTATDFPRLSKNPGFYAAALLGAAIATAAGREKCLAQLGHDENIIRKAAAIGLMLRPPAEADLAPLRERFDRTEKDNEVRALQVRALAAVSPRTSEIRALLLEIATRHNKEKKEARIAALIALADEPGVSESYEELRKLYRRESTGNDPLAGALLFAMARTGEQKAGEDLLTVAMTGSAFLASYAVGSLLDRLVDDPDAFPDPQRIFDKLERRRAAEKDALLLELLDVARVVRTLTDPAERRAKARPRLAAVPDPRGLHLWDRTAEERVWDTVNSFLYEILAVDDIADRGSVTTQQTPGGEGTTSGGGARALEGSPDEQDLIDFLNEKPYFGPDDLGLAGGERADG